MIGIEKIYNADSDVPNLGLGNEKKFVVPPSGGADRFISQ